MIAWYLALLHKPVIMQTSIDRFWIEAIPVTAAILGLVLVAVVQVWREGGFKRRYER